MAGVPAATLWQNREAGFGDEVGQTQETSIMVNFSCL